ncbi:MAG TPA: hypothetical protein VK404_13325 [Spirosoma sp.]|nr:hypothetical protein [Spirosoma sp.]
MNNNPSNDSRLATGGVMGQILGGALLIGAAIGYILNVPKRLITGIMAFGSGVLFSALAFELMDEAYPVGGSARPRMAF